MQSVLPGQPLDRDDLALLGLPGQDQTGADERAVHVHRARSTLALLAGVLGTRKSQALAQHVEQALALPHVLGLTPLSVYRKLQPHQPPPLRYSSQAHLSVRRANTPTAWTL